MLRFLLLLLILPLLAACDGGAPRLNTGSVAPGFSATRLDGSVVRFPEDFCGKPVAAFIRKIGVSYSALLDEKSAIARQYGVTGLPTTYFVGADGMIKAKVVGEAGEAVFDKFAGELLP